MSGSIGGMQSIASEIAGAINNNPSGSSQSNNALQFLADLVAEMARSGGTGGSGANGSGGASGGAGGADGSGGAGSSGGAGGADGGGGAGGANGSGAAGGQDGLAQLISEIVHALEGGGSSQGAGGSGSSGGLARIIHRTARNRPRPPNTWARNFIAKNFIKQPIRIVVSDINSLALIAHFS